MIVLSLGSNVGDRSLNLQTAVAELKNYVDILEISSIFKSDALLHDNDPEEWNLPFFNIALTCATDLLPRELIFYIKKIEKKIGRPEKYKKWSPRIIDIDIIAYDDLVLKEDDLQIPHPEMHKRDFVLTPMHEVCPNWQYPYKEHKCYKMKCAEMLEILS